MKCPHCLENFHEKSTLTRIHIAEGVQADNEAYWGIQSALCPACGRANFFLCKFHLQSQSHLLNSWLVWPKTISHAPLSPYIPDEFSADYREACLVFADSPKSSAALSRRCLQHLLREKAKVKKSDLSKEIQEVLDSRTLPSYLSEAIDAIRNIGNFAAHPLKSTNTGEILDVEPGEAEWTLDVLEQLFDFYFVGPAQLAAKRAALNQKLAEAGKPPMK